MRVLMHNIIDIKDIIWSIKNAPNMIAIDTPLQAPQGTTSNMPSRMSHHLGMARTVIDSHHLMIVVDHHHLMVYIDIRPHMIFDDTTQDMVMRQEDESLDMKTFLIGDFYLLCHHHNGPYSPYAYGLRCYKCKQQGHPPRECPNLLCEECKEGSHGMAMHNAKRQEALPTSSIHNHVFLFLLRLLRPFLELLLLRRARAGGQSDGHLEALAPEYWDARDWDFSIESEDDESVTDGEEDLRFLVDGELEAASDDDLFSWEADLSSDEEEEEAEETEEDSSSSAEYPLAKRFRAGSDDDDDDDDEEDEAPAGFIASDEEPPQRARFAATTATTRAATARRLGNNVGLVVVVH
ncbi:hypothetical protein QYE76_070591 [Lolium multiflorum]|uniref:CCHC-type domain-containing protein n=1 Tax=Lolium multiflorum TaxID=4521 RepID=A0AAD8WDS3_LOLMU|nr:hypothetical protein QYE76_070591 [Lolium multiflorum]